MEGEDGTGPGEGQDTAGGTLEGAASGVNDPSTPASASASGEQPQAESMAEFIQDDRPLFITNVQSRGEALLIFAALTNPASKFTDASGGKINTAREADAFLRLFTPKKKAFNKTGWRSNAPLLISGIQDQDFDASVKYEWKKDELMAMLGETKLKVENWTTVPNEGHFFLRADSHKDGEKHSFVTNIISSAKVFNRTARLTQEDAIKDQLQKNAGVPIGDMRVITRKREYDIASLKTADAEQLREYEALDLKGTIIMWTVEVEVRPEWAIPAKEYFAPGTIVPSDTSDSQWMVSDSIVRTAT